VWLYFSVTNSRPAMMKTNLILYYLALTIILFSCKKDDIKIADKPNFGFTANSINYKWNFVPGPSFDSTDAFFKKVISLNTNDTMYMLIGINLYAKAEIYCSIHSPEIKEGVYKSLISMSDKYLENFCSLNNELYGTFTGDIMRVTITKIENNFASGTFGAEMHDLNSQTKGLTIWDGYFNHVAIAE
jgi:hypothetical protein